MREMGSERWEGGQTIWLLEAMEQTKEQQHIKKNNGREERTNETNGRYLGEGN